eukprot:TRINITY_DN489_c0_g1_i1.p1 TRINITY_DN489_c0_g1~~TRINITY_DN489_c0_g1_i1.p1  ORF type:complete len:1312 (+),score=501.72 TRINITY_DN489_c0_g1_i1:46-3981(+)
MTSSGFKSPDLSADAANNESFIINDDYVCTEEDSSSDHSATSDAVAVEEVTVKVDTDVEVEKKKEEKPKAKKLSIGQLFRFVTSRDKALIVVGSLAAVVHGAFWPAFAFVFGQLVDAFGGPPDELYDEIASTCLYFVYFGLAAQLVGYVQHACFSISAEWQVSRLRKQYLQSVMRQEAGWLDCNDSGQVAARLISDTTVMQEAIGEKFGQLLQYLSGFFLGCALAFASGWKLTLVQLATTPLLAAATFFMMSVLANLSAQGQQSYAKAGSVASEVLSAIRTVASFNGEEHEAARFHTEIKTALRVGYKRAMISGFGMGSVYISMYGSFGLSLWYGIQLVKAGEMDAGPVLTVFFAVLVGAFCLGQAGPSMEAIGKGQGAIYTLYETIDRVPVIDSSSDVGTKLTEVQGRIEIRNVTFSYPKRPEATVLRDYSLSITPGQTVALVGSSGCGKSSTVGLLQRFYDPQDGSVLLDGVDVKDMSIRWLRSQFGVVGQEPVLFSGTIADNIRFGRPDATQQEIEDAARMANIHSVIAKFPKKYETFVGEKGAQLSGGQKQRIAIARTIIRQPKVLLLDEATSALDTESERIVQDALDRVMKGRTTIVVAHRLSTVRNADVIVVLDKGSVAEKGTHDELMSLGGIYKGLVEAQGHAARAPVSPDGSKQESVPTAEPTDSPTVALPSNSPRQPVPVAGKASEDDDATDLPQIEAEQVDDKTTTGCFNRRRKPKSDDDYVVPLSRVVRLNRNEFLHLLAGSIGALLNAAVNPAYALVFGEIVGLFYASHDRMDREAGMWAVLFFAIGVAAMIGQVMQAFFFGFAGERLTYRLRRMAFSSMLRQNVGWFDLEENSPAVLSSRLASDAALVEGMVGQRLGLTVMNVFTILSALALGFAYSWRLTLVMTAALPVSIFSGTVDAMTFTGFAVAGRKLRTAASRLASESVGNMRTVASFGAEQRILTQYSSLTDQSASAAVRSKNFTAVLIGAGEMLLFFTYGLGFWYGGVLVRDGLQNAVDIFKVFSGFMMTGMAVGQAAAMTSSITKAKAAASAVFRIIDRRPPIDSSSSDGAALPLPSGAVDLKSVVFRYPSRPNVPVLQGLTISAKPGSVVALVGPSGCGKSSAVALLERFYDPEQGQVLIDDVDIRDLNIGWLRSQISMVGQEPVLFAGTIRDNIAYGMPDASFHTIVEAAKQANAHKFILSFPQGYDTFVGEKGAQLSGGQKQRVAIARAIVRNPRILLLDEATSALDTESEKLVQQALDRVMKGRTTIVIAHRLSTIRNADQIYVIDQGAVVERGTHDELLVQNGVYRTLVSRQGTH